MKNIFIVYAILGIVAAMGMSAAGYVTWNTLNPKYTCAQCHEIAPTHERWTKSAHADVACTQCHGTAISYGFHSLKEKVGMVFSHISKAPKNSEIRMTEENALKVSERCADCHRDEAAKWRNGAHSTKYANIFEDKIHNAVEKPYWDCLRCHGMFYEGNIETLMSLEGKAADWKIKDVKQRDRYAIPCLACHEIHAARAPRKNFKNCYISAIPADKASKTSLYVRIDKDHIRSDKLADLEHYLGEKKVRMTQDPDGKLCIQCHSPNWRRDARSCDDRSQTGVHKGFSCVSCHDAHSNSAAASCAKCHPQNEPKYKFTPGKCPNF